MNIDRRLDDLERAIAGRVGPGPTRRWDFSAFTTDQLLHVRELLQRRRETWTAEEARLVHDACSQEMTANPTNLNSTEDHHG